MASTVTAVRPPQRWPADPGVGGALVQSHPCCAPVQRGGFIVFLSVNFFVYFLCFCAGMQLMVELIGVEFKHSKVQNHFPDIVEL